MVDQGYLLLVEDEPLVQANNKIILERRGYNTQQAYTLSEARAAVNDKTPCAIILDNKLPDGNGLDFLKELRRKSNIPVLMLTGMGAPEDIIKCLESGGDDYLPKPYDQMIFLLRVEALLRRSQSVPESIYFGSLKLEPASGTAYINGERMPLTTKEYLLLQLFVTHPKKVLSIPMLFRNVWGQESNQDRRSIRKAISRLRRMLEGSGYVITNDYNEGYIFERE